MGDSYRPDRRHRSRSPGDRPRGGAYYDFDKADDAGASSRRGRYDGDWARGRPRGHGRELPRRTLDYEGNGAPEELAPPGAPFYTLSEVQLPQYSFYTRSDDLRFDAQTPRYFDGSYVPQVPPMAPAPTGENDLDPKGKAFRFVLVRGLKPNVTEEVFAKGMTKFYRGADETPHGAPPNSLKRVFIIRTRETDFSLGFGFAEYDSDQDAQGAVLKALHMKKTKKCTIGSNDIEIGFAHLGIFHPMSVGRAEHNVEFTFVLHAKKQERYKYHDERYYASELVIKNEPTESPSAADDLDSAGEKGAAKRGTKRTLETAEGGTKKAKGAAGPIFAHHQKWQNKHKELHTEESDTSGAAPQQPASGVNAITPAVPAGQQSSDEQTFVSAGTGKIPWLCNLCNTGLKDTELVQKHLERSEVHASALKDAERVRAAYQRMKARGVTSGETFKLPGTKSADPDEQAQPYRDRAAERREEEDKSGRPMKFSLKSAGSGRVSKAGGQASGSSSDNEPSKPSYGKGMAMLQKAGWSEGRALGSGGGGITGPIDQNLYAAGVGLGHESSKKGDAAEEAARMTRDDRTEYAEKAKDESRKRFAQMD